jgi:MFS family permease
MSRIRKQVPVVIAFFLLGALFFEIYWNHEPVYALHRGGPGLIPIIYTPLALGSVALVQVRSRAWTWGLFAFFMAIGVVVGIAGTALHQGIHAFKIGSLLQSRTWLGEPPTLAPLSFSVGGLAGLLGAAAGARNLRDLEAERVVPRAFYLISLFLSLVAFGFVIAAIFVTPAPPAMSYAFLVVLLAVAFDLIGALWDWVGMLAGTGPQPVIQEAGPDL